MADQYSRGHLNEINNLRIMSTMSGYEGYYVVCSRTLLRVYVPPGLEFDAPEKQIRRTKYDSN